MLFAWTAPPAGHSPAEALKSLEVVHELSYGTAAAIDCRGPALEWDVSKSDTIALTFEGAWFLRRRIEVFAWSTSQLDLDCSSGEAESTIVSLNGGGEGIKHAINATFLVAEAPRRRSDTVRLSIKASGPGEAAAKVYFKVGDDEPAPSTRLHMKLGWNPELMLVLATWVIVCSAILAALSVTGLRGLYLLFAGVPILPAILGKLNFKQLSFLDPTRLALIVRNNFPSWAVAIWTLLGIPAFAGGAFLVAALAISNLFQTDLQRHLSRDSTARDKIAFFCDYPERIETRATLARLLDIKTDPESLVIEYNKITTDIPVEHFLQTCLSTRRLSRSFLGNQSQAEDEARIFYASLHWNSINSLDDISSRMQHIRSVLRREGQAPAGLVGLALAKYELKALKNLNERLHCKRDPDSDACKSRKAQCLQVRTELEKSLKSISSREEQETITYIEARDVAATARMSAGCGGGSPADVDEAIAHYGALVGAVPREPKLDQLLSQVNLRKLADGLLDDEPRDPTSRAWKDECGSYLKATCDLIRKAVVGGGTKPLFASDPGKRSDEWGKPSLPYLQNKEFGELLLKEAVTGWRIPPWK